MSDVTSHGAEFDRDRVYPVLPLRDIVVFPGMIVPLFVGREKSVKALEEVMRDDKHILVVTQKNAQDDDPAPGDIFATGTIASVLQLLKLPDGTVKVLVEGLHRATIDHYLQTEDYFEAEATALDRARGRCRRGRGAGPLGADRVRELRQAQQEDLGRGRQRGQPDRERDASSPTPSRATSSSRSPRRKTCSRPFRSPSGCRRSSA